MSFMPIDLWRTQNRPFLCITVAMSPIPCSQYHATFDFGGHHSQLNTTIPWYPGRIILTNC